MAPGQAPDPTAAEAGAAARPMLTFRVGATRLAVPAADVAEVSRPVRLTRAPHAPASLEGIASLRGRVAPVVSVARLLDREGDAAPEQARVIFLNLEPPVGLAVDEVTEVTLLAAGAGRPGELFIRDGEAVRAVDLPAVLRQAFAGFGAARRTDASSPSPAPSAATAAPRRNEVALLTFDLAGQAYALPLDEVQEVIALPASLALLPSDDAADLGVIPFREAVLPIVSVRALLGLPAAADLQGARVVATRIGTSVVGLLVDRLNAILRLADDQIGPTPAVLNRGGGEARIAAIGRLDDGRGLVSILSAERLFRDEALQHILADGRRESAEMTSQDARDRDEAFVIFRLGAESYGLPMAAVEEIVRMPEHLTPAPRAPGFVLGVMNLRGKVLPVIDQGERFGLAAADGEARRRVIVTRVGTLYAGFAVDAVSEILHLTPEQLSAAPELAASAGEAPVFDRVAHVDDEGRLILLIDPQALLDRAEADLLAAMADGAESGRGAP